MLPVTIDDGQAAVFAEGPGCNLDAGRRLSAFVLVSVDSTDHLTHHLRVEAQSHHLLVAAVFLHVGFYHRVQHFIGGQAVLVQLALLQLSRGEIY